MTGVEGCKRAAKLGLIWASRDMDGESLGEDVPELPAAAVNGEAAASVRDVGGAATLLSDDIESGVAVAGVMARSPSDAGAVLSGLSDTTEVAGEREDIAEDSVDIVPVEEVVPEEGGALTTADTGFFINL